MSSALTHSELNEETTESLDEIHARMRARDRARIENGEATPDEIQEENSFIPKPKTWRLPYLTA